MKKFWLVGRLDDAGGVHLNPLVQHPLESAARAEAESLARKHSGTRFVILEAIDNVRKSDIAWEPCYDGLPF